MRALTFQGIERVDCESVPEPRVEQPGDAVVGVELTAICGSDLHVYHGRETGLDRGTILGHEFYGEVLAVGSAVANLEVGQKVIAPFTTSCGTCFYCRRGLTARCESGELFGWVEGGAGLHGAQAEQVRVPLADSTLVAAPEGVAPQVALLAGDVLSTGFFCAEAGAVVPGSVAAVLGCGPVGLMAVLAARELGAVRVFAVDRVRKRLELAAAFGAVPIDLEAEAAVEVVREATSGRGADCVLEAVGNPSATRLAVDLVRPGGVVSAAGVHTERHFAFSPGEAYDKNLTYSAGRCPARRYIDRVLPLLADGRLDPAPIISHRLPLAEGPRGYEIFAGRLEDCTKVVLEV